MTTAISADPHGALVLTDDELAAIAFNADLAWSRPLLTIDTASESAVADAIVRGFRTLALRGFIEEDRPTGLLLQSVATLADRQPLVVIATVDETLHLSGEVERIELFAVGNEGVTCVSAPSGVHVFSTSDLTDAMAAIGEAFVETSPESSGTTGGGRIALLLRNTNGQRADSYLFDDGGISLMEATESGWSEPKPLKGSPDWPAISASLLQPAHS